jgi:hypothetical protein
VTACSLDTLAAGEPLAGTAPFARAWIVIEQPGPWGRDAVADSRLPEDVRAHLRGAKAHGVSVLLVRHPDRPERVVAGAVNVWLARSAAGGTLLRHGVLTDLADITGWDLAALGSGSLPAFGSITRDPLLLVCTHARRDRCCAVNGRPLLASLFAAADARKRMRLWECSHIGGHRFSPVTLSLPLGVVHGRLTTEQGRTLLAGLDDGRVVIDHVRGRSCFPGPLQAAAIAVQAADGIEDIDAIDVLRVVSGRAVPVTTAALPESSVVTEVRHRDGRAWRVTVELDDLGTMRTESCDGNPEPVLSWSVGSMTPTTRWS